MTSPYTNENNLSMVHANTKILSSILAGVTAAALKCMKYPGCIDTQGSATQGQGSATQGQGSATQGQGPATQGRGPATQGPVIATQTGGLGITDVGTYGANVITYIETTIILIVKIIGVFSDTIAPVLEETVFGDLANKPWEEIAPKITGIIKEKKDYLDKMSRDPEIQQALKEWAEAYATIAIQTTEAIRPSLNLMIDEALETLSEAGSRAATGDINLGLNLTEAAIGEIPVAGGIIDIVLAIIRGVNQGFRAASPTIQFGLEAAGTGYNTANKVIGIVNEGKQRVEDAAQSLQKLTDKFKNIGKLSETTLNNVTSIGKQMGQTFIEGAMQGATNKVQGAVQSVAQSVAQGVTQSVAQGAAIDASLQSQVDMLKAPSVPVATDANAANANAANANAIVGGAKKQIKKRINKITQRLKNTLYKFNKKSIGMRKTKRRVKY